MAGAEGVLWTEELSSEPRASLLHNFLLNLLPDSSYYICDRSSTALKQACVSLLPKSKKECEYLISVAKPHLKRSRVVDEKTGGSKESSSRTSSGMFIRRGQGEVIRRIEKRIADYTSIPVEHGENLQILHYEVGQKFDTHFDYTENSQTTENGGPRQATLLMYLSDVEDGGETVFPSAIAKSTTFCGCAKRGISVKPKMGDALLFWSMKPDGSRDPRSLHGARPVIKGDKWSATKWIHVHEYKVHY